MPRKIKKFDSEENPKERIMETALKLFYIQGYNNTGINQILEESKTFKLSFYNYFTSKENLGIEYIKRREKTFLDIMKRIMKNHPDYSKFIHVWITLVKKEILGKKYNGCPFVNLTLQTFGKEEVFKPHIKSMILKWKKLLAGFLFQNYHLTKTECFLKAGLILQIYEGAVQLYMATGNMEYILDLEKNLLLVI